MSENINVKELGFDSLEELQVVLKNAEKANASAEEKERITTDLTEVIKSVSELTKEIATQRQAKDDSDAFDELSASKLVEKYHGIKDPVEKAKFRSELASEFGQASTNSALDRSQIKRLVNRPIHKGHSEYERTTEIQKAADDALLLTTIRGGTKTRGEDVRVDNNVYMESAKFLAEAGSYGADILVKGINEALDTQTATEGSEWVPTELSATLLYDLYLQLQIASAFQRYGMPAKTTEFPIRTARSRGYRVAESTVYTDFFTNKFTAHNMETSKVTFVAEKLGCLNFISEELNQDSVLEMLGILKQEVAWGLASCIDDACLNGSTGATLDGALWSGTTDARSAWDGIRTSIGSSQKVDLSTVNTNAIANLRKTMGKFGMSPNDLVLFVAPKTAVELTKLEQVLTIDKYGANATIVQGEIGKIFGIPIVASEYVYETLNNSGVYDGVTTDKTIMVLVNKHGFAWGDRRMVRVESDRQMLSEQIAIASSWRGDFQKTFESSVAVAALGYKIS